MAILSEEWRHNGRLYPLAAFCTTSFGCLVLLIGYLHDYVIHKQWAPVPPLATSCALIGVLYFVAGPFLQVAASSRGRSVLRKGERSTWMLTLPLADRQIAAVSLVRHLLSNAAAVLASVVAGACFWLLFHAVLALLGLSRHIPQLWEEFRDHRWVGDLPMALTVFLFLGWVGAGISEAAILAGRRWTAAVPHMMLLGVWIGLVFFEMVFGRFTVQLLVPIMMLVAAFCVWITIVAIQTERIPWTWGLAGLGLWVVAKLGWNVAYSQSHAQPSVATDWLMLFLFSTVLLPISLPPLAVAWNRQR